MKFKFIKILPRLKNNMVKARIFPVITFVFTSLADILIYILAYYLYQTGPWPSETITSTSCNFPGYIVFRSFMIYSMPMMQVIWYTEYWRLKSISKLYTNGQVKVPHTFWIISQIGSICGVFAVSTIDTGKMNNLLHGVTAVIFFSFYTIAGVQCTGILKELQHYRNGLVSSCSLKLKQIICSLLLGTWFLGAVSAIINNHCHNCDLVFNACEWIIMTLIQSFILSFYLDWGDLEYVFKMPSEEVKNNQNIVIGVVSPKFQVQAEQLLLKK